MEKIVAAGTYCGKKITVEAVMENDDIVIFADGEKSPEIQQKITELIKVQPAMAGTFYPDENSMLAVYNVLKHTFFDAPEKINIQGEIVSFPYRDGKTY